MPKGPLRAHKPKTVVVSNGIPYPDAVELNPGQKLLFCNDDAVDYIIQFKYQGTPLDVCPFLRAEGIVTFEADPDAPDGTTDYIVERPDTERSERGLGDGGGHVIIVGSGTGDGNGKNMAKNVRSRDGGGGHVIVVGSSRDMVAGKGSPKRPRNGRK